jgi:DNA polymerase-3 subunit alpha
VVSLDDFSGALRLRANEAYTLGEARRRFARELVLQLGAEDFGPDFPEALGRLLGGGRAREGCAVRVVYSAPEARVEISLGAEWRLSPSDEALGGCAALRLSASALRLSGFAAHGSFADALLSGPVLRARIGPR